MTSVALIGDAAHAEFATFVHWIRTEFPSVKGNSFADVSEWQSAHSAQQKHQITLVLQSHSDQYSPDDVSHLVGATLFSGLFCCFGAWCEGDGRTRQIWPCSIRVPLRYAKQVVGAELRRMNSGRPVLPPTAARDEVFFHRQASHTPEYFGQRGAALVVSPDRVYRLTFAQAVASCGWDVTDAGLATSQLASIRPPDLVVHDLDPQGDVVTASVDLCAARFPDAEIFGMANLPQELKSVAGIPFPVLPKLDPFLAVEQILEWFRSASEGWPNVVTLL